MTWDICEEPALQTDKTPNGRVTSLSYTQCTQTKYKTLISVTMATAKVIT